MVTRAAKDLLKNTIRSTDYHNKLLQEQDMWRQYETDKGVNTMDNEDLISGVAGPSMADRYSRQLHMDTETTQQSKKRKMFSEHELRHQKQAAQLEMQSCSSFWTQRLMEAEENDPDRWGHAGYKELYPEEFNDDDGGNTKRNHHKKKKKEKHSKHKHKKKKSHTRQRHKSSESDQNEKHTRNNSTISRDSPRRSIAHKSLSSRRTKKRKVRSRHLSCSSSSSSNSTKPARTTRSRDQRSRSASSSSQPYTNSSDYKSKNFSRKRSSK